jgi:hypothetical protein
MQPFTSYKNGHFVFAPNSSAVGTYKIGVKMIDIGTSEVVLTSAFNLIVRSSLNNPNLGHCPSANQKNCLPRIASVSMYGIMTITFPYSIKTVDPESYPNVTDSLNITFIPSNSSSRRSNSSITSWNVTDFKPLKMTVQLAFFKPLEVSMEDVSSFSQTWIEFRDLQIRF